jgi:hypothetical protein
MDQLGVNPIERLCVVADRRVSCGTCIDKNRKPTGKTKFKLAAGFHAKDCTITLAKLTKGALVCTCEGIGERTCESCFGTLWERIPVTDVLKASAELAQYKHAKRKALEVSGSITQNVIVDRLAAGRMRIGKPS